MKLSFSLLLAMFTFNSFACPDISGKYLCDVTDYLQPEAQQNYKQLYTNDLNGLELTSHLSEEFGNEEGTDTVYLDGRKVRDGLASMVAKCIGDEMITIKMSFSLFGSSTTTITKTEKGYKSVDVDEDGEVEIVSNCVRK